MSGIKQYNFEFTKGAGAQVTPDEIDRYEVYHVIHPGTAHNAIGTAPVGTSTTTQTFVITNTRPDFPRNLLFDLSGSNDIGGTCTVNGFDQFGNVISESMGGGTVASPGTQYAGSLIFAQVTSASMTFAAGSAGSGTPKLGYASGTANAVGTALGYRFGLPTKIQALSDVKAITWDNNTTTTAINSGSINSTVVGTTPSYYFRGTSAVALTDIYTIWVKSTWDNASRGHNLAALPGTP